MHRIKIFAGTIVLVLILIVATSSKASKKSNPKKVPEINTNSLIVDKEAAECYKIRKENLAQAIQKYFDKAIASGDIVGAGLSIVKGDSTIILEGFGKRKINAVTKVDSETVFRLGSLSKGFTGVLAANLVTEGKLNWSDKVVDYLPDFQLGDKKNTKKITLAHILSHSSGTPYHSFTNLVEAGLSMEAIANRFKEVVPNSEPGAQYSYQNAMFALSQEMMKKTTGKEINQLMTNQLFKPLGMSTISIDHAGLQQNDNVAIPHYKSRRGWKTLPLKNKYYNAIAAGGINASSSDMSKWMHLLLGHRPDVMKKSAIKDAFQPSVKIGNNRKYYQRWAGHLQSYYGFGWRIHKIQETDTNNKTSIWHHGGSVNNYRNEIAIFPDYDMGICVLLNGNSKLARNVIPELYALVKESFSI